MDHPAGYFMPRLFVALSIPEEQTEALRAMQSGLDGARWRPAENFHLTLAFIGETDRRGMEDALDALSAVEAPGVELRLAGLGAFGERKPRAVWAGVEPSPGLAHLQARVETALRRRGFDLERRKFVPHVTLAYLKGARAGDVARYCAGSAGVLSAPAFAADAFHLYSSRLGGEASHYEIEASYALSSSR